MDKTAILVPCYNEAERLDTGAFERFMVTREDISFFFVDDGSTDNTCQILNDFADRFPRAGVIHLEQNQGKAEALRLGAHKLFEEEKFRYMGFWDADLATPLGEIPVFLQIFGHNPSLHCVMGARIRRLGADIDRSFSRHFLGRIFATAASLILRLPVYDTQCGAKLFTYEVAAEIFKEKFISRWYFDIELLFRIKQRSGVGGNDPAIFELPLRKWHDAPGSKIKLKDFLIVPFELYKIYRKYRKKEKKWT
ncbi:MAG: glycosyltransferase [bacterium]|nr:glycosyltransferase [bacterium]